MSDLKSIIAEMNGAPYDADNVTDRACLFLLTAAKHGTNGAQSIAYASGLRSTECREFRKRARSNGIFVGDKIAGAAWFDDEEGGIAFLMDAMCVAGLLTKSPASEPSKGAGK